ncbi:D-alanyl-D-alanine carboxypeptidase/D-alanyl-D-alanine endopeptidase [Marinobacterium sediminicola]|uniref:D-alanyl-D-alanine carboxypeptidase / D-alanyl-D-alanine-endopeptidase (Penicillin-binding protein 4) n=1 Tax=Marinobacterium sediminicola TaxID=518898 RepID=A0ABY1S1C9_9GAMM|nr:D-alanyl-D-alanine carboxypeptidase/D-alanyl-D-alanine-endopeptidase [Marinobacterium sediminicola]ULG69808.1 D-alanyl-D-alanine carboxypeptidase/D-alanyl-D-alanine-endopeptidase [Marinobacterium sediminicola]SMR75378.1 D-alanyl-D-alanine carboxypeptidase / D-alanyl-D-alanine-endopeptidase (penicillin-binding protein 4) [Marinobacterium sediminicola]
MLLRLFILLILAPVVHAAEWKKILDQAPAGSQVALVVEPLGANAPLQIHYRDDRFLPPASTLKLFTATAAELELGEDYRFETRLWHRGQQRNGRWQGDWLLEFRGAPDLNRQQLAELLEVLRQQSVREIEGDLLLDVSYFTGYDRAIGWPWNNLGVCYSAPASALTLEGNCVAASLTNQGQDRPARFFVPAHQPIEVTSEVVVRTQDEIDAELCELESWVGPGNRYHLSGCINDRREVLPLNFAINDPIAHGKALVRQELSRLGIVLRGEIRVDRRDDQGWQLASQVESAPLATLLTEMLQDSDNLIADLTLKNLGAAEHTPGSFARGVRAMKNSILTRTGIDLTLSKVTDGSGLSRDNLMQASQLAQLLQWLARHPDMTTYKALPVSGENGTLKYRRSTRQAPLKGAIQAKSGTVNGTRNLAGYITTASGERYVFVLMLSGISLPDHMPRPTPVTVFEKSLLEWIYHNG